MKYLSLIILSIISLSLFAQPKEQKIPRKIRRSIPLLTQFITEHNKTDRQKVDAIYTWITENIAYDYDQLESEKYLTGVDPETVLKSKKAICNGYVELMKAMLDVVGIENETITGYIHDMHWVPGKLVLEERHAWIAIRFDEKWHLADPTWDAGYIGRIPTNLNPYKAKVYKKTTFKKPKKEKKVLAKREKKEISRKRKYDDKPLFTNKIGFVSLPEKKYFLIESDTFLLTHLPILPFWQLRDDFISIEDFSKSTDSIRLRIDQKLVAKQDYYNESDDYIEFDYLNQRIVCGDQGADFNKHNPALKALYYYNYMALINDKNLQKLARGSKYEIGTSKYKELNAKTDTIVKYIKLYKDFEKLVYKQDKEYDKKQNKLTISKDKLNSSLISKTSQLNTKTLTRLDKNNGTIKNNLEKISSLEKKIESKYPKAIDYVEPNDLNKDFINLWIDTITTELYQLQVLSNTLDELRAKSKFNNIISNVDYINYLLEVNANYIPFNSYSTTEITNEIDSLITTESENTIMLFIDSIPLELLPEDLMNRLKRIENLIGNANASVKLLADAGKIDFPIKYETYFQSRLLETIQIVKQINLKTDNYNRAVEVGLKKNGKSLDKLVNGLEEQEKLKLEKYEYIEEQTENDHLRNVSLIKKMISDTKKWKAKFEV